MTIQEVIYLDDLLRIPHGVLKQLRRTGLTSLTEETEQHHASRLLLVKDEPEHNTTLHTRPAMGAFLQIER